MNTIHHSLSFLCYRWCLASVLALSAIAIPQRSFAQAAAAPQVIPFQGRLTNQAGVAYTNGQYSIIFNLYTQAIGGSTLWTERHEKVGVVNGMVNVFLGSITSMTAVDFSTVKYLGITVDVDGNAATADPEMVPRQMIIPAFWAKQADNSTKLVGQDWSALFVNAAGNALNDPAAGFIQGSKLRDGSIPNAKIADGSITNAKVADGSVNLSKLSPRVVAQSAGAGGFALSPNVANVITASGTDQGVPGLSVTLTTTGRPVFVACVPHPDFSSSYISVSGSAPDTAARGYYSLYRDGVRIQTSSLDVVATPSSTASSVISVSTAVSTLQFIDIPSTAGNHTYEIKVHAERNVSSSTVLIQGARLVAYEL